MNERMLPTYDRHRSYEDNYAAAPSPRAVEIPAVTGDFSLAGIKLNSPLGVAAGPLLNGAWCHYYAELGFDLVTYKTVRSRARPCYPLPNLTPVDVFELHHPSERLSASEADQPSWAVSFGMPSRAPEVWQADVQWLRQQLKPHQRLSVSVVGTAENNETIEELADDYAWCAERAVVSGAEFIEANFSCPNVTTCDGQLYQIPAQAEIVAARIKQRIGKTPLLIKIGFVATQLEADQLVSALAPIVDGLVMTNSIAAHVVDRTGEKLFAGQQRGICGPAIFDASLAQVERFQNACQRLVPELELVGVGGISNADDVRRYLAAGASAVQLATAAMRQPDVAIRIKREWK